MRYNLCKKLFGCFFAEYVIAELCVVSLGNLEKVKSLVCLYSLGAAAFIVDYKLIGGRVHCLRRAVI